MERMGHTSPAVALRYQHVMADRQGAIAAALDGLARDAEMPKRKTGAGRGDVEGTTVLGRGVARGQQSVDLRFVVERAKGIEPSPRAWEAPSGRSAWADPTGQRTSPSTVVVPG
jgi:hypothetical protein